MWKGPWKGEEGRTHSLPNSVFTKIKFTTTVTVTGQHADDVKTVQ